MLDAVSDAGSFLQCRSGPFVVGSWGEGAAPVLPRDVQAWLFPPDAAGVKTYFLVDASARRRVVGVFDLDPLPVPGCCLFRLEDAPHLAEAAPYLLHLDPAPYPNLFMRQLLARHWGHGTGIFLRSAAPMAVLRDHLRRFVRLPRKAGDTVVFRFWDPQVMAAWLVALQHDAARLRQVFGGAEAPLIAAVLADLPKGQVTEWRADAALWDGDLPAPPPQLGPAEMAALSEVQRVRFCVQATAWITEHYHVAPDFGPRMEVFAKAQLHALAGLGITTEYAVQYALAGLYLLGCGVADLPDDWRGALTGDADTQAARSEQFLEQAQIARGIA
jgi:hypothetical protein